MPVSPAFVEHAQDLLASVGLVQARRLFGGYGLYARGVMFALLDDDELFLKADDLSRPRFVEAGCRPWIYPGAPPHAYGYWRPPDEAHEEAEAMAPWAALALEAAERVQAGKVARARAAEERRRAAARKKAKAGKGGAKAARAKAKVGRAKARKGR